MLDFTNQGLKFWRLYCQSHLEITLEPIRNLKLSQSNFNLRSLDSNLVFSYLNAVVKQLSFGDKFLFLYGQNKCKIDAESNICSKNKYTKCSSNTLLCLVYFFRNGPNSVVVSAIIKIKVRKWSIFAFGSQKARNTHWILGCANQSYVIKSAP